MPGGTSRGTPPRGVRRVDGELILLWTLPAAVIIWIAAFFLFPGFNPPMSPTMSAEQVAAFYRDPAHIPQIRYSMIVFNWFGVCLVPILTLIVMQIRRMAHRTPIFSYAMLGLRGRRLRRCFSSPTSAGCWPRFARSAVPS